MKNNQFKGIAITSIGVLAFVPDSLLLRLIDADILPTLMWRGLFSGFIISFWSFIFLRNDLIIFIKSPKMTGIIYMLFHAIGNLLFITAIELTSVANSLFIMSTSPIFSVLISRFFLKEPFDPRILFTIFGALIGISVIAYGSSNNSATSLLGDLAALGMAICLGISLTAARTFQKISIVPATGISSLMTGIILFVFINSYSISLIDIYFLIILSIIVSFGTTLLSIGPKYITSAEVGLILLMEAILAPILVWFIIGENPGSLTLVGGFVVLVVLFVSNIIALKNYNIYRSK